MKSDALMLGAAVTLAAAGAMADVSEYWEKRDVTPASEDKKPERKHFERRETNPGVPEEKRPLGFAVETGGGVGGFMSSTMSGATSTQGQWSGRFIVGTRRHFGGEAAYLGSAQTVSTLGVQGATLFGNGAEGAFRYHLLTGAWQPYAAGGIGFMHYSMNDSAVITTSDVQRSGTVMTFPVGVGVAWRTANGLMLDSRLSFHPATSSAIIRGANMSTWDLQAKAGFEI